MMYYYNVVNNILVKAYAIRSIGKYEIDYWKSLSEELSIIATFLLKHEQS
jgi:hypothetical protein